MGRGVLGHWAQQQRWRIRRFSLPSSTCQIFLCPQQNPERDSSSFLIQNSQESKTAGEETLVCHHPASQEPVTCPQTLEASPARGITSPLLEAVETPRQPTIMVIFHFSSIQVPATSQFSALLELRNYFCPGAEPYEISAFLSALITSVCFLHLGNPSAQAA